MCITGIFFDLHVFSRLAFSDCIRDGPDESLWRRFQISTKVVSLLQLFTIDITIVHMLVVAIKRDAMLMLRLTTKIYSIILHEKIGID